MLLENWLSAGLFNTRADFCPPLKSRISCDVLVIGGGFAGLHAALRLADKGKDVVLLEKSFCGGSSSGKSGGFLTPSSEADLTQLINLHGLKEAKKLYDLQVKGIKLIVNSIRKYKLNCDLQEQEALYLAISNRGIEFLKKELEAAKKLRLNYKFYDINKLQALHPGEGFYGGLLHKDTYGINSLVYTQKLKNVLLKKGVRVYEYSEAHGIKNNIAKTHLGSVKAKNIIVCIDKMSDKFDKDISKKYYHMQTYLAVSDQLSKSEIKQIFPRKRMMCWDTRNNYLHYRIIGKNRLIIGGSSLLTLYYPKHYQSPFVINRFIKDFKRHFPCLNHVKFVQYWNGLIDVTKDLLPIVDYDPKNKSIQYVMGCAGLPWAAFCGDYAASRIIKKNVEDYSKYFGLHRKFFISESIQRILGKPFSFLFSHLHALTRTKKV